MLFNLCILPAQADVIITGADDCALKTWDIRNPHGLASSVNRCASQLFVLVKIERRDCLALRTALCPNCRLCGCRCGHGAGVCCIQADHVQDFLVYTGCYDENVRSWDLRKLTCPIHQVVVAVHLIM